MLQYLNNFRVRTLDVAILVFGTVIIIILGNALIERDRIQNPESERSQIVPLTVKVLSEGLIVFLFGLIGGVLGIVSMFAFVQITQKWQNIFIGMLFVPAGIVIGAVIGTIIIFIAKLRSKV